MTTLTVQLSDREVKMLKVRTGERDAIAALRAWVMRANSPLLSAVRDSIPRRNSGDSEIEKKRGQILHEVVERPMRGYHTIVNHEFVSVFLPDCTLDAL